MRVSPPLSSAWMKGKARNADGSFCAGGAPALVCAAKAQQDAAMTTRRRTIRRKTLTNPATAEAHGKCVAPTNQPKTIHDKEKGTRNKPKIAPPNPAARQHLMPVDRAGPAAAGLALQ